MTVKELLITLVVALSIALAAALTQIGMTENPEPATPASTVNYEKALTTPCASEDADNCYWNAQTMGNGTGESFVTVDGITYYLTGM